MVLTVVAILLHRHWYYVFVYYYCAVYLTSAVAVVEEEVGEALHNNYIVHVGKVRTVVGSAAEVDADDSHAEQIDDYSDIVNAKYFQDVDAPSHYE